MRLTFSDLFSGIGGFRLGLERAGMRCVFSCEKDLSARRIYEDGFTGGFFKNLGHPFPDDIRYVEQLPDCDVVAAGFPCQDVSIANNDRKGLEGERSGLFFEIIRLLQSARNKPQWVILENVFGLLSSNKGRDFAVVIACLQECGYGVSWRVLDSRYFGVPQRRRRVYIVGYFGDVCPGEILFEPESSGGDSAPVRKTRQDVAYTLTASVGGISGKEQQATLIAGTVLPMKGGMEPGRTGMLVSETLTKTMARCSDYPNSTLVANDIALTLLASQARKGDSENSNLVCGAVSCKWRKGTGGPSGDECQNLVGTLNPGAHPGSYNEQDAHSGLLVPRRTGVRRLMPLECERLQGFPDMWTAGHSDSQRYMCCGNAATTYVPEWIARRIDMYRKVG